MSATYRGPVFVAHYAMRGRDGTLTGAMHRRVAAASQRQAQTFAKAGCPQGHTLEGVRPAEATDRQAWL